MIKGGGGVQTPPKKHDIINEQPLSNWKIAFKEIKYFYYMKEPSVWENTKKTNLETWYSVNIMFSWIGWEQRFPGTWETSSNGCVLELWQIYQQTCFSDQPCLQHTHGDNNHLKHHIISDILEKHSGKVICKYNYLNFSFISTTPRISFKIIKSSKQFLSILHFTNIWMLNGK